MSIGKVCSRRQFNLAAFDRAMQKAWGLHREAEFEEFVENIFVVRFNTEGDCKHVMNNGPWQFDFHAFLLKEFDGSSRPSDMSFSLLAVWVRVLDLPLGLMNEKYGLPIRGWIGDVLRVEVDKDGTAWGDCMRLRIEIPVDQPLVRGVCTFVLVRMLLKGSGSMSNMRRSLIFALIVGGSFTWVVFV